MRALLLTVAAVFGSKRDFGAVWVSTVERPGRLNRMREDFEGNPCGSTFRVVVAACKPPWLQRDVKSAIDR